MKDNPLISIYMPTWNRQQLAIRAIKSVLRQDYSNWEMIIVDQQAYHCIPNRRTHAACSINAISLAIRFLPGRGVSKSACSIPN